MKKHKYNATNNKSGKAHDLEGHQKSNDVVVSDWSCREATFGNKFDCHISMGLDDKGKPLVEISVTNGVIIRSKELCRLLYEAYYVKSYLEKDVTFRILKDGNLNVISHVEMAYAAD